MKLKLKVFLEGPFSDGKMHTQLNKKGFVPNYNPYNKTPKWLKELPSDVVDWVLVGLKETNDTEIEAYETPALLYSDGSVNVDMFVDASIPYYIQIKHRNHMRVLSHQVITFEDSCAEYDFTTQDSYVLSIGDNTLGVGQKLICGDWVMYAGDIHKTSENATIDSTDDIEITKNMGAVGYHTADLNMDGIVSEEDNRIWEENQSARAFIKD